MSDFGKRLRLNRLFKGASHKPLVVAFDHALPLGPIQGTVDPAAQVAAFTAGGADAILATPGMVKHCVPSMLASSAPSLIMRMDWSSLWTRFGVEGKLRSEQIGTPEQALRNGADAVLTYLLVGTGDVEFEATEIRRNADIARECEKLGIPLIVESLERGKGVKNPLSVESLNLHTRIAAELGADVIKTEYSGSVETMAEVVKTCPIPILVLGGARKKSDEAAFDVLREIVQSGAHGVFYGRNVFQSADPVKFLQSARAILGE